MSRKLFVTDIAVTLVDHINYTKSHIFANYQSRVVLLVSIRNKT